MTAALKKETNVVAEQTKPVAIQTKVGPKHEE
jgi:hypothetical protein